MSHTRPLRVVLTVVVLLIAAAVSPFVSASPAHDGLAVTTQVTSATVNPRTGLVRVQVTLHCSDPAQGALSVTVRQYVGKYGKVITGSQQAGSDIACDGDQPSRQTFTVFGMNGRFGPGQAIVEINGYLCPMDAYPFQGCTNISQVHTVRLKSGK